MTAGSGVAIGLPRELRPSRRRRSGALPAVEGLSRDRLGQLLDRDERARSRTSSRPAARRSRSTRSRSTARTTRSSSAWRLGRGALAAARRAGARLRDAEPDAVARRRRQWRPRRRRAPSSACLAEVARRLVERRRAAARRRRRRDLGRRACRRSASRGCASAPRSIPACRGGTPRRRRRRRLHLALKSGNFGSADFFDQGLHGADMSRSERAARRDLPRRPLALRPRLRRTRTAGNISARLDDGFLITPTDACLGDPRARGLAQVDATASQAAGERARARRSRCTAASTTRDPTARCVIHTHSTPPRAASAAPAWNAARHRAADHAVLRDEGRPRAADRRTTGPATRRRRAGRRGDRAAARAARRSAP